MRCLIYGSGLSAGALAWKLKEQKHDVTVVADNFKGGLCGDYEKDGVNVHVCGPHIFRTSDESLWKWLNSLDTFVSYINTPIALHNGEYFSLPFNMYTLYQVYGTDSPVQAKQLIEKDLVPFEIPNTAEEAALSTIGKTLYEKFVLEYTKKQWKKHPKDLPASILARIPIRFDWNNNYYSNKLFQGFPLHGYTSLIGKMFRGCKLLLSDHIESNFIENNQFDKVFICEAPDKMLDYKFGEIPYLQTKFEVVTDSQNIPVLNYNDSNTEVTRRTNYALLWPFRRGENHAIVETPIGESTTEYGNPFEDNQYTIKCYPAHDLEIYNQYKEYCDREGYILVGRLAENLYLDMKQAILNAWSKVSF